MPATTETFGSSFHSSLREHRDVAKAGIRHTHRMRHAWRPQLHQGRKTTAAGPRAPFTTCPTIDVVVLVVRRSLLRSR